TKFAVGIFAGGVVFATLLPDVQLRLFGMTLSPFWVGSVAVVALTGIYTTAGGMRGVAYTDAAQTIILIIGSVLITVFGLAWLGMLFCAPIVGLWYWTTDQYIVQRALAAPNEQQARRGSIFAGFLKLLPVFIFIIPGMIALALARTGKAAALAVLVDAAGNP